MGDGFEDTVRRRSAGLSGRGAECGAVWGWVVGTAGLGWAGRARRGRLLLLRYVSRSYISIIRMISWPCPGSDPPLPLIPPQLN